MNRTLLFEPLFDCLSRAKIRAISAPHRPVMSESSLSPAQQRRLEQLSTIADVRSLTAAESSEIAQLVELFDRSVLRRAKALAILAQRGYRISDQQAFDEGNDDGNGHSSVPS